MLIAVQIVIPVARCASQGTRQAALLVLMRNAHVTAEGVAVADGKKGLCQLGQKMICARMVLTFSMTHSTSFRGLHKHGVYTVQGVVNRL